MPQSSLHFDLPDSGSTESLGAALARAFAGARADARTGSDAVAGSDAREGGDAGTGEGAGTSEGAGIGEGSLKGAVVHLRGELGSGKTTCVRSLLHELGITATVRSPTYTLVDTYSTPDIKGPTLHCVHVDLYRLRGPVEVEELGLRDLTGPDYLMLIEWPEQGGAAVPPADLDLQLCYAGESRAATLRAASELGERWLAKLGLDSSLVPYVSNLT